MRLYIGIALPEEVRKSLFCSQLRLKRLGVKGSWKAPAYFHITLEFLGELPGMAVEVLSQILDTVAATNISFQLQLNKIGAFPSFLRPHTIWAGVDGELDRLNSLWHSLHEQLEANGFILKATPFHPHITLLSRPKLPLPELVDFSMCQSNSFEVSGLILFESKIEEGKRVYPQLHCSCLKEGM